MKMKPFFLIALTWCSSGLSATLEFSGYIESRNEFRFIITDIDEKSSSGWITIGQSFNGHRLVAFDRQKEVLSVKKGESTLELRLKESRVQDTVAVAESMAVAAKLTAARKEYMQLRARYTLKHPRVAELLKIINELEGRLQK
jgi:hypothetical protein